MARKARRGCGGYSERLGLLPAGQLLDSSRHSLGEQLPIVHCALYQLLQSFFAFFSEHISQARALDQIAATDHADVDPRDLQSTCGCRELHVDRQRDSLGEFLSENALDSGAPQQPQDAAGRTPNGCVEQLFAPKDVACQRREIVTAPLAMPLHQRLPRLVRDVRGRALGDDHGATTF
jgi:hypothetical protein